MKNKLKEEILDFIKLSVVFGGMAVSAIIYVM